MVHPAHGEYLRALHGLLWLTWGVYWLVSARNVKKTVRRETGAQRALYVLPLILVLPIFLWPKVALDLTRPLTSHPLAMYWIGTVLIVVGLAFTIWARHVLGRNWSGSVTVKEDHELVQTGPYRLVRHPIYSGLLLAITGSILSMNRWLGFYILVAAFATLWLKMRREEQFMRETFGEKYTAYCSRTKRLVPWLL